jgi:hypothetical protein
MHKGRLFKIRRWFALQWNWGPHKPALLTASIIFFSISILFLFLGAINNPSLQNAFQPQPTYKLITSLPQSFDIPDWVYPDENHTFVVKIEARGTNFAVGAPIELLVSIHTDIWMKNHYDISLIEVAPLSGMNYRYSISTPESHTYQSYIRLSNSTEMEIFQYWTGSDMVVFRAGGPLAIKINLYLYPPLQVIGNFDHSNWTSYYTATARFPDIEIASEQIISQQRSNDITLSLTYIVLFFACLDIGVVFYDHSEDKDEDKQYEYRQKRAEKKRRYRSEEKMQII